MIKKALVAAATLLTLAGCSKPYVDYEPEPRAVGTRPDASITATLTPSAERLAIAYTLRNDGARPIVAYVGVISDGPAHDWDVYVTAREDGTVEIAKRTFVIPPNVDADWIGEIKGLVIAPGDEFTESFQVDLPLRGSRPYLAEIELPDPVEQVVFCVGVAFEQDLAEPVPAEDGRGKYPLNGPQHLFCSEPRQL